MAGPAVERQLTALPARPSVRFTLAGPADDAAIRQLLRANPMHGAISLTFEREPDYFAGAGVAGADDQTILAYDRQRLVCVGRCSARPCWINGQVRRVGYLAELRLDASAQGRVEIMRGGYRFFRELHGHKPAEFYFTSIAADNERARRLLERGVPGLPRYEFLADYVTVLVPVPRRQRPGPCQLERATAADLEPLAELLNVAGSRRQLATAWTTQSLHELGRHDLPVERFYLLKRDGRIAACAAVWDQRCFRQTVIQAYAQSLGLIRPLHNLAASLTGRPRLPSPGSALACGFVSPLACSGENATTVPDLVRSLFIAAAERGLDFLALGYASDDPNVAALRRSFHCRTYGSRIYRVLWPEDNATDLAFDHRSVQPDVALL